MRSEKKLIAKQLEILPEFGEGRGIFLHKRLIKTYRDPNSLGQHARLSDMASSALETVTTPSQDYKIALLDWGP